MECPKHLGKEMEVRTYTTVCKACKQATTRMSHFYCAQCGDGYRPDGTRVDALGNPLEAE